MWPGMNIPLDLTRHCIETAIKRRRNAAISSYFRTRDRENILEAEIALLGQALEVFDFNRLRSQWPALSSHSDAMVTLTRGPASQPIIVLDTILIVPPADPA
jgi:hypothetical protein